MNRPFRLGFVDHVLNNWHANVYIKAFREQFRDSGFEVAACTATDPADAKAWAAEHGVPYFASVEAMDPGVDGYVIFAPSNPERHLDLCRRVFPFRKQTFVDKTFAPDLATARQIFALADEFGVAVQTSSALRYTAVQRTAVTMGKIEHMIAWGAGNFFQEYAIHVVEMIVSCMGPGAKSLMRRGTDRFSQLLINFNDGRTAVGNVYLDTNTPFAASLTSDKETAYVPVDVSTLYLDAIEGMLEFFRTGRAMISREESLMVRRILDAAEDAAARDRFVVL